MKQPKQYNLVYIVNGKIKETVESNKSYSICKYRKSLCESSGHYKHGLLQLRQVK